MKDSDDRVLENETSEFESNGDTIHMPLKILYCSSHPSHSSERRRLNLLGGHGATIIQVDFKVYFGSSAIKRAVSYVPGVFKLICRWKTKDVVWLRRLDLTLIGTLIYFFNKNKVIVWDVSDTHRLQFDRTHLLGKIWRILEKKLAARADLLLLTSGKFFEEYYSKIISEDKTFIVENRLQPDVCRKKIDRKDLPRSPIILLHTGIFRSERILLLLAEVCRRANGACKLVLAGVPERNISESAFASVISSEWVEYIGKYHPADLPEIYEYAHFAVGLVDLEADYNEKILLPNRLYQAGLFRCPILATRGSHTAEIAEKENIGLVVGNNVEEILNVIHRAKNTDFYAGLTARIPGSARFIYSGEYEAVLDRLSVILSTGRLCAGTGGF
jgi:hypothetical protein